MLRKSSECNASLGCISNPESTMMLTWQPASTHVLFTLRGYIGPGDLYVAVGLSHDDRMVSVHCDKYRCTHKHTDRQTDRKANRRRGKKE